MTESAERNDGDPTRRLVEEMVKQIEELRLRRLDNQRDVVFDYDLGGLRCILMRSETRLARDQLTPREREIARAVGRGRSNKEIARELSISTWTVAGYLRRIFAKLDVTSRAEMVATLMDAAPVR
jgi:DNA-binding CsgD family transcriptional regulator